MTIEPVAGVYAIRNRDTGRVYIGSSRHILRRWESHRAMLKSGKHQNARLLADWREHGPGAFSFELLEATAPDPPMLLAAEQRHLNALGLAATYHGSARARRNDVPSLKPKSTRLSGGLSAAQHEAHFRLTRMSHIRGSTLKRRRRALGLSIDAVAHELSVTVGTIARWEHGTVQLKGLMAIGADTVLKRLEQSARRSRSVSGDR